MFNMVKKLLAVICVVAVLAGALPLCSYASGTDNANFACTTFEFSKENQDARKFTYDGTAGVYHTFEGNKYFQPQAKKTITFTINIPEDGYYNITRNWYNTGGNVTTTVDGSTVESAMTYTPIGVLAGTQAKFQQYLTKGDHTVTVYTTGADCFLDMTFTRLIRFSFLEADGMFTKDDFASETDSSWSSDTGYYLPNGTTTIKVNAPIAGYYRASFYCNWNRNDNITLKVNGDVIANEQSCGFTTAKKGRTYIEKHVYLEKGDNSISFKTTKWSTFQSLTFEPVLITDGIKLKDASGNVTAECTVERGKLSEESPRLIIATYKNDTKELIDAQLVDFTLGTVGDKETKTVNVTVDDTVEDIRAFLWTFDTNGDISKIIDFVKISE